MSIYDMLVVLNYTKIKSRTIYVTTTRACKSTRQVRCLGCP
uniref:Uncharacterized protein n=1 Tax=Anguilla anguilla TaxID=7936 RepID=A0A0E9TL75_ANGAN